MFKDKKTKLEAGEKEEFYNKVGKGEDYKTFITYSFFELMYSDRVIFTDTIREYEFGDKLYPIVLNTGANKYELLFEVNDRPNKNYLLRFFVQNERIVRNDNATDFYNKSL